MLYKFDCKKFNDVNGVKNIKKRNEKKGMC